ncbi:MAG: ABC transporter ATP-binding protein, partial [Calditrichaeota bacterium]
QGTIYSIIGPNGAGKTTIFNCISGIYQPDRGDIFFNGQRITGKKPHQIARLGIARSFQNLELFSNMTTRENLMLGRHMLMKTGLWQSLFMFRRNSGAAREEIAHRRRIEHIIEFLELQSARDKPVRALPYGRQKLVELGRALAMEPQLLLLDEPSAGMNSEERQDLHFWLQDIKEDLGVTILMIEHNMQMVMGISDRVLAIDFGKKLAEGPPQQVANHPEVIKAYLGEDELLTTHTEA